MMIAESSAHSEFIENIKKEYGVIFDKLFEQGREKLAAKDNIAVWLYHKNKEEFNDIRNLMTDLKVESCFSCNDEQIIKKELETYVKEKIQDEAQKVFDMDGVTAENAQDFFDISRMICDVTLESDETCYKITRVFKKEYHSAIKELKIVDKARVKITTLEKERTKQELLSQLREQIILGTCPRK
jgi:metal-sulfur cluster biosynthetic enzyme